MFMTIPRRRGDRNISRAPGHRPYVRHVLASTRPVRGAGHGGAPGMQKRFPHRERGGHDMGIMSIIGTIIVGFIVGLLARFFYPGAVNLGFWMTTLLGIGGSLVGGIIGGLIWKSPDGNFHPAGWILSILGAIVLLWGYLNFVVK
jgi:uncharacterized membrane protein YeaQ/YmgE (transglycosylase-associated protein family)